MIASSKILCAMSLAAFALAVPAFVQSPPAADKSPGCPPYANPNQKLDVNPLVDALDQKKDNHITHEEWVAAGAPESSWKAFTSASHKDYVTREEFQKGPAPNGIDLNCDGKVTIEEFRAFDKMMSAKMKNMKPGTGGGPGGPPPPAQPPK